jgi:hypothetical protein
MTTFRTTLPWLLVLLAMCCGSRATAQPPVTGALTTDWTNATVPGTPATNNWMTPANWSGGLPDVSVNDFGVINNGGVAYVNSVATQAGGVSLGTNAGQSGTLDILSGGSLTLLDDPTFPADGSVRIGQGGTGTLYVRPGGSLNSVSLTLGAASATSSLNLGGTAAGTTTVSTGAVALNRSTRVTGPNVNFTATGAIGFGTTSTLIAELTGSSHSPLKTAAAATLGGTLQLDFNYTPATTHSWNLVDAATISGSFTQIVPDPSVMLGLGQTFAVRTVNGGVNGKLAQLYINQQLVLNVNRDTGAVSITNPGTAGVAFDGYAVQSSLGNLNTSDAVWNSLEEQPGVAGSGWVEANPNANRVAELRSSGVSTLGPGQSWSLGNVFDPATPAEFGDATEDLVFSYTDPTTGTASNLTPIYSGSASINNLVLFADPTTGNVKIRNTSPFTVAIDGYTIASTAGSLNSTDSLWNSLSESVGNTWEEANLSDNRISELQSSGSTTLNLGGGTTFDLGNLFKTVSAKDLAFQFVLAGEAQSTTGVVLYQAAPAVVGVTGDYNNDGTVNAADYTIWRDHLGQSFQLQNEGGVSPGVVDAADYTFWKSRFGATSGSGGLAASAVPEPAAALLTAIACLAVGAVGRGERESVL